MAPVEESQNKEMPPTMQVEMRREGEPTRATVSAQPGCAAAMVAKSTTEESGVGAGGGPAVSKTAWGLWRGGSCGEALAVPSEPWGVASDPEGTFTPATVVDPGTESTLGGLDSASATTLSAPATCRMSAVYSVMMKASCRCWRGVQASSAMWREKMSGLWSDHSEKQRPSSC